MAGNIWKNSLTLTQNLNSCINIQLRHGHHLRGKAPGIAKSLQQKLQEMKYKDPKVHFRVDIGLPPMKESRSKVLQERLSYLKTRRNDKELEAASRHKKLSIDLQLVYKEWLKTCGPHDIKKIADHYGVYRDLFGDAYFYPRVPLQVFYNSNDSKLPVFYGNTVKPLEAVLKPEVEYQSNANDLWTLLLTNPDGHFVETNKEYVHWFIGNIPGNSIDKGETLVEYLQPFPPKGTGYQRFIFVLYKQNKKLDLSQYKRDGKCLNLAERTFSTYDFYKSLQDDLTPVGLTFFQSDWDSSLKQFYHNVLEMKVPVFEYDFPQPYIKPQVWFPLRQPFNLYMDKYRDPKQINKEYLLRKLKNVHPFKAPEDPLPYPNAVPFLGYVPTWLKLEKRKSRMRWGRINDIE